MNDFDNSREINRLEHGRQAASQGNAGGEPSEVRSESVLSPQEEVRLLSGDEQIDTIRALVSLFDDQGAVIGDVGPAVNRAYEVLSHTALLHPEQEAIAKLLWHRFGDASVEEWEDETHKAEFLEAADDVIFRARVRSSTAAQAQTGCGDLAKRLEHLAVRIAPLGSYSGKTRWEAAQAMREAASAIPSTLNDRPGTQPGPYNPEDWGDASPVPSAEGQSHE